MTFETHSANAQQDEIAGDIYEFGSRLRIADMPVSENYFIVGATFPDLIFEEVQFPYPILSFAGETVPPRSIRGTVERLNFRPPLSTDDGEAPTRDALYLTASTPIDLRLTFDFTGEQILTRIDLEVVQRGLDCQYVLKAMTENMGPPSTRLITSAIWRLEDIDRQEVLDVRCQQGQGYVASLSDPTLRSRFESEAQETFLNIWRRYRRIRRR